jgi:hypothetical protein
MAAGTAFKRTAGSVPLTTPLDAFGGVLIPSDTYDTDTNVAFDNMASSGVIVVIDMSTETEAGVSIVFTLQGLDPVSGAVWDLIAATVTDVGTTVLQVSPNLDTTVPTADADGLPVLAVSNVAKKLIPPHLNLKVDHADGKDSIYSVAVYFAA